MTNSRHGRSDAAIDSSDKDVAEARRILSKLPFRLMAFSGKMAAGKDTVAPLVSENFAPYPHHMYFSSPLHDEVNDAIAHIREAHSVDDAVAAVVAAQNIGEDDARRVVGDLYDDVKGGIVGSSYDRTDGTRDAMQYWGTDIRRRRDGDYWVRAVMRRVIPLVAGGSTVYITDARFPNELDAVRSLGGILVRLNVSPSEQARRLLERDGVRVTEEMRAHPSETAVDDYDRFDITLDTTNAEPRDLAARATALTFALAMEKR